MKLQIEKALHKEQLNGRNLSMADIMRYCWPKCSYKNAWPKLDALRKGRAKTVKIELLNSLCDFLNCSADYLLGRE